MSILSTIFKAKRYIKTDNGYQLFSEWQKASEVEFNNGSDAETTLGAINGITSSLNTNNDNYALSAAGGYNLQSQVTKLNTKIVTGNRIVLPKITLESGGLDAIIYTIDNSYTKQGYEAVGILGVDTRGAGLNTVVFEISKKNTVRLVFSNISATSITRQPFVKVLYIKTQAVS